jgi:hypothetical protein
VVDLLAVEQWIRVHADPVGAIETVHERPWATVLRVPLADGIGWFKACAPAQAFEPRLSAELLLGDRAASRRCSGAWMPHPEQCDRNCGRLRRYRRPYVQMVPRGIRGRSCVGRAGSRVTASKSGRRDRFRAACVAILTLEDYRDGPRRRPYSPRAGKDDGGLCWTGSLVETTS